MGRDSWFILSSFRIGFEMLVRQGSIRFALGKDHISKGATLPSPPEFVTNNLFQEKGRLYGTFCATCLELNLMKLIMCFCFSLI